MDVFKLLKPLGLALLMGIFWSQGSFAQTGGEDELSYRDQVQIMYVAYYGRPGDAGGLDFWATELEKVNGNLFRIIDSFGNSMEFTERFGDLDDEELVNNIFLQLLGKNANSGGLNFYVNGIREGRFTLASIALNVADGTKEKPEGRDNTVKTNKLRAANAFSEAYVEAGAEYGEFQIDDAKLWLGEVDSTEASVTAALDRLPDLLEMFSGGMPPEPASGDGKRYEVGDAIATLPTGTWFPDLTSGDVSFGNSGGSAVINFGNGGNIGEGGYRYTCQSTGGCQVRNRQVESGTIVQTLTMAGIIPDANLLAAIEAALGKASGAPITATEMEALTHLTARDAGVSDLTGLEFATNLTGLELDYNDISDVSSLAGLTNLTELYLRFNTITDVSSLEGLTKLTHLALAANEITDVSPLGRLTNLTSMNLDANKITDVSVLGGLINLRNLQLEQNAITDASGVGGLVNLKTLRLAFNAIMDVSSLQRLTNLLSLDLRGNPLSVSSINDHIPALERDGVTVRFDRFRKGDFDIELVFLGDFIEGQKNVLKYVARRWMSVIAEDLPDYEFTQGWSGMCGGQSIEIPSGERIDDLRIYVGSFEDADGPTGYGGSSLLRESHLPIFGCMTFNLKPSYMQITGLHEVGHVLGFGRRIWGNLGFYQDPDGDQHFNGPLAIAAFDDAGGWDYTGKKVPVEESHWRYSVLRGELMGPRGGEALSAITVQSLADLGYGVDVTQADAYTLPGAAAAQASAMQAMSIPTIRGDDRSSARLASPSQVEPELWCSLDGEWEPIYVVDQQGRIIRTIGN